MGKPAGTTRRRLKSSFSGVGNALQRDRAQARWSPAHRPFCTQSLTCPWGACVINQVPAENRPGSQ